ncbi:MAG TPA: DUF3105 domain-containing protein, partial [Candidatus Dormibacteraeota bacterium]|nr:DUF3105 domain-containing protein [Candidatus Dormibacteraeota bacterium]
MFRLRSLPLLLCAALGTVAALSACGSGSADTVDNSSCQYGPNSAGPYSPNPPKTNGKSDHAQVIPEMPHEHLAPPTKVTFAHNPPTSGCHYSLSNGQAPIAAGAYPYTATIPAEYWVHNLEHGYMAVLYRCPQGCDADFQALRDWMKKQAPDLRAVSPINFPGQFTIPVLLVHGKKDQRVPVGQSREMAEKLGKAGKKVRYIEQPLGDHHLSRQEDRVAFLQALEGFLKE